MNDQVPANTNTMDDKRTGRADDASKLDIKKLPDLLTVREVAEMLGKSIGTVKQTYMKKKVHNFPKPIPLGRKYYFILNEINEWILNRQRAFNALTHAEKASIMEEHDGIRRFNRAVKEGRRIHPRQRHKRVKKKNV